MRPNYPSTGEQQDLERRIMSAERENAELGEQIALARQGIRFYAVARHGTAGLGWSYGYAEVAQEGEHPRADQTTTISGPHTKEEAEKIVSSWNTECDKYRNEQDAR